MPGGFVEKSDWFEQMQDSETILLGAFAPSLTKITMEIECKECGRPVYLSPKEREAAIVICIVCGLKYFDEPDREILSKALMPQV